MGIFHSLIISIVHLLFVVMDVLLIMTLIKVIYQRWRPEWLRQINNAVTPVVDRTSGYLEMWVARITGKTYTDKTMTVIFILCLSALRFVITSFLQ